MSKVYLVGAGPGDPELLTQKAVRLLKEAGLIVYAGSLIPKEMLDPYPAPKINSAPLVLEEIINHLEEGVKAGHTVVRLHSGDPCLYGAIREETEALRAKGIPYEIVPGVSSFLAGAAALAVELTVPEVSQTVILTRAEGKTPVPERERLSSLASHQATMVLFLSASLAEEALQELIQGGYSPETPAACVYRAGWPEEKVLWGTLADLALKMKKEGIQKQALIFVGQALRPGRQTRSKLYHPSFSHGARKPKETL